MRQFKKFVAEIILAVGSLILALVIAVSAITVLAKFAQPYREPTNDPFDINALLWTADNRTHLFDHFKYCRPPAFCVDTQSFVYANAPKRFSWETWRYRWEQDCGGNWLTFESGFCDVRDKG